MKKYATFKYQSLFGEDMTDEVFINGAVKYLYYNKYAEVLSDGQGNWLVSYLDGDDKYIDVKYDSQGIVYLALQKGYNRSNKH